MKMISEWNTELQKQIDRPATPEELAELDRVEVFAPPPIVSMRQAKLALFGAGLLAEVESAIAAIADADKRTRAQIEWTSARDVERNHPFTQFMAVALGLPDAVLDDLFRAAATF